MCIVLILLGLDLKTFSSKLSRIGYIKSSDSNSLTYSESYVE